MYFKKFRVSVHEFNIPIMNDIKCLLFNILFWNMFIAPKIEIWNV